MKQFGDANKIELKVGADLVRSNEPKMARYSMAARITTSSPVRWDKKEFNLGIIYNNGIITIDEPGYYRITAAVYTNIDGSNGGKWINLFTYVNGSKKLTTKATSASPGFRWGFIL